MNKLRKSSFKQLYSQVKLRKHVNLLTYETIVFVPFHSIHDLKNVSSKAKNSSVAIFTYKRDKHAGITHINDCVKLQMIFRRTNIKQKLLYNIIR